MTVPTVALERATASDVPAIRHLDGLGRSTLALLEHGLSRADHRALVARVADQVVGFVEVVAGAGEVHLLDVAVAPAHRRAGIATALVTAARRVARDELGARAMTLEVRASNAPARALYRRLGFVEEGTRRGYYPEEAPGGGREDAIVMWDRRRDAASAGAPDDERGDEGT